MGWQEQNRKLDGGGFVDIRALSHDLTIRERIPRTHPNILLG